MSTKELSTKKGTNSADDVTDPETGNYFNGSNHGFAFVILSGTRYPELNHQFYIGEKICGHSSIYGDMAYMLLHQQGDPDFADYKDCIEKCADNYNIVHFPNLNGRYHRRSKKYFEVGSKMCRISEIAQHLQDRARDLNGRLFVNNAGITGFNGYSIIAVHRPKQHLNMTTVRELVNCVKQTMHLDENSLAFKLGVREYVPYTTLLERGFVYE